jgi:hypothetical protein
MRIRINTPFFFAFGFGTGMDKAQDMWIFETLNGVITCIDASSKAYNVPQSDVVNGGTNDIVIVGQDYDNNGFTTVKFYRAIDTSI